MRRDAWLAVAVGLGGAGPVWAAERLNCPPQTQPVELPEDGGSLRQCQRPDGTPHGPSQQLNLDGRVVARGFFEEGVEQGSWRYYDSAGRIVRSGQMAAGRPEGAWTHFDVEGDPSATLTHGVADRPVASARIDDDPLLRWRRSLTTPVTGMWRIDEQRVAVALRDPAIWILDLHTGELHGRVPLPAAIRPDVVVEGESLLAVTAPGELVVVDLSGEQPHWRRVRTPVGVTHVAGLLDGETALVRSGLGRVDGLDLETGEHIWTSKLYVDELAPVRAGAVVAAVRDAREVRAVTVGTGDFAWQTRMSAPVADLLALGSRVHVLTRAGELLALDRETGAPLWSLDLGPGATGQLSVREDALWVSTPHAAWRIERRLGTVLSQHVAEPPFEESAADLVVGGELRCTTGRRGGLRCSPGDWELDAPPAVVPPLVSEGIVLLADATGELRAVDAGMGAAVEGVEVGGTELLEEGERMGEIRLGELSWEVDLPWLMVEQALVERDCTLVTAAVGLPGQADVAEWAAEALDGLPADGPPAEEATATLYEVALQHGVGAGAFAIPDDWSVEEAGSVWRMSWWHRHRPTIAALSATLGDAALAEEVDALLRCESGPARFRGGVHLDDGYRTMEAIGMLDVVPHPHSLDGEAGCLLDLSVAGEDLGSWSSPQLPAWSEILMEVVLPEAMPELPEDTDFVGVPERLSGEAVLLDLYEPWKRERTFAEASGEVDLRIDEGDVRGPMLRAYAGPRLLAELPVPDLQYGQVVEGEDGEDVPAPDIEDVVHLERRLPESAGKTVWRVAWQRSECLPDPGGASSAESPEAAEEGASSEVASGPPAGQPPAPKPPSKSRWWRGRRR